MNKIIKSIFTGITALTMVACADLDLNPLSEGSSKNWYRDETEIEWALNDLWRADFFPIDDVIWTDDMLDRNSSNEFTFGTMTDKSGVAAGRWSSLYKSIVRATKVINALQNGSATGITDDKMDQYMGEAYFMVGFAYCELATYYGDCVLNKGLTLDESYTVPRTPKREVLNYAYECLDRAAELLPERYAEQQRPTAGAALGFKARFALFHQDWQTAAKAAKDCMDLGVYDLHDNYLDLFKADSSPELIFYFKGDLTLKKGQGPMFSYLPAYTRRQISGSFANKSPSLELFCTYTCTDGLPIDESPLYNPKDPFENRDPRLAMTIQPFKTKYSADYAEYEQSKADKTFPAKYPDYILCGYEYNPNPYAVKVYSVASNTMVENKDGRGANQHSAYNGLMMRKYVKPNWMEHEKNGSVSDNCFPYLRYAEVLMTYLEAMNELGEVTPEILDATINAVRERAYRGTGITYPRVAETGQERLRTIIRIERRSEFAFEGLRYRDLLRWRIAEKSHNKPMYQLPVNVWSGSAGWNGKKGAESNITLSAAFQKMLANWDAGCFPVGGVPEVDEDGLPDLSRMEAAGFFTRMYMMSFDKEKNYLWPIPAGDRLVNPNLTQNPKY